MINEIERRSFWYEITKTEKITHDEYGNPMIYIEDDFTRVFNKVDENETWNKELPKMYQDSEGWLVEHWKDGRINKIRKLT
jgi:hypothetical protein